MKLATLREGGHDGTLVVVDREGSRAVAASVPTLQRALETWDRVAPRLEALYRMLNEDSGQGFMLDPARLAAPLPRTYQWLDGSAYLTHVERVRRARGAELPEQLLTDPLMYQGGGDTLLGPRDPICVADADWGPDFEAEVGVITDAVPMGVTSADAAGHIKLLVLVNDISLRNLIPAELAKGFGFLHGKPSSALSPVAVTPDELNGAWDGGKLHLPLLTHLNGQRFGDPDTGEDMQFDFPALISHAARTRRLTAGTLIGSGTVSNADTRRGCSCLVEKRVLEVIETGAAHTPFLQYGDRVRIEMLDREGHSVFGAIEQEVIPCPR
ncbi:MAG: fumarylacetoacetate hydrolase family protein [Pseudomonadota bacterium]|nr:fumarylacetoacetate hydrolase family protein [Pseudomonadota bacterium]